MEEHDMPALLERMGTTEDEAHSLVKIDWSQKQVTPNEATVITWMLRNEKLTRVTSLRPHPGLNLPRYHALFSLGVSPLAVSTVARFRSTSSRARSGPRRSTFRAKG